MNYRKKFRVKPGKKIRLKDFDPQFAAKHEKKKSALPRIEKLQKRIDELQFQLYAENKRSLLICLQAPDAQIIVETMENMGMKFPQPTVNIADIRRKYHRAAAKEKKKK